MALKPMPPGKLYRGTSLNQSIFSGGSNRSTLGGSPEQR
jgi:hypothetical protein